MSEIIKEFEKIDKFLELARTVDAFENCHTIYDLFEIKNKNAAYPDIEKIIKDFVNKYSGSHAPKYKIFGKSIAAEAVRIETILKDHRREYNEYLRKNDPRVKQLRHHFDFCTEYDGELDSNEKNNLIKKGNDVGFTESEMLAYISEWLIESGVREANVKSGGSETSTNYGGKTYYEILGIDEDADYATIKEAYDREYVKYNTSRDKAKASARFFVVSEAWECLKDPVKRREYDEKLKQPKTTVPTGEPRLVVEYKTDLTYRDIRRGTVINIDGIVIKNTEGGLLQGTIKSDVAWLEPDRNKILEKHEQKLYVNILTSKIPANTYDATGNITINSNGGVYSIPFRVILEGLEIAVDRFKKTYVPLIAACAGFIGSLSSSPVSYFFFGALIFGAISYASAELIVKYFFNEGIDIFKMPPVVIQGAAVLVPILAIMVHLGGSGVATVPVKIIRTTVGTGINGNDLVGGNDTFIGSQKKLVSYTSYEGAIPNKTIMSFQWYRNNSNFVSCKPIPVKGVNGNFYCTANKDFSEGNYEVALVVDGKEVERKSFKISAPVPTPASVPAPALANPPEIKGSSDIAPAAKEMFEIAKPYHTIINSDTANDRKAIAEVYLTRPYEYECHMPTVNGQVNSFNGFIRQYPNSIYVPEALLNVAKLEIYSLQCPITPNEKLMRIDMLKKCYLKIFTEYKKYEWSKQAKEIHDSLLGLEREGALSDYAYKEMGKETDELFKKIPLCTKPLATGVATQNRKADNKSPITVRGPTLSPAPVPAPSPAESPPTAQAPGKRTIETNLRSQQRKTRDIVQRRSGSDTFRPSNQPNTNTNSSQGAGLVNEPSGKRSFAPPSDSLRDN